MHIPLLILAGIALLVIVARMMAPSVDRAVDRALETKQLDGLEEALRLVRPSRQPDAYNRAIRRLWDAYERELAAALVRKLAEHHPEQRITQYWLDQVQQVEPELARRMFEDAFLSKYFRPEVAARCGSFG